jgi:hypothetical protein
MSRRSARETWGYTRSTPSSTLSSALIQGKRHGAWNTTPRSGPGPWISRLATATLPSLIALSPATMVSTVDLPQPEWPISDTNSFCAMFRSKPRTTATGPLGES